MRQLCGGRYVGRGGCARGTLRAGGQWLPPAPAQRGRQVILDLRLHQQLLEDLRHVSVVLGWCLHKTVLPVHCDHGFSCVEVYLLIEKQILKCDKPWWPSLTYGLSSLGLWVQTPLRTLEIAFYIYKQITFEIWSLRRRKTWWGPLHKHLK